MRVVRRPGQIAQIHEQIAKAEVYRGFHPACVAASGLLGVVAAAAQPWLVSMDDSRGFVTFWLGVAAVCGFAGSARRPTPTCARTTSTPTPDAPGRGAVRALRCGRCGRDRPGPAGRAGRAANPARAVGDPVLPRGFAARPYLPRATGWVALWYLTAGAAMLATAPPDPVRAGWAVGLVFAAGQCATAIVLHRNEERAADV